MFFRNKYRTLILVGFVLTAFLILKPKRIQEGFMLYPGVGSDDYCYLAHATAMVFGQWPNYSKEKICLSEMPMASVGPALMSLPLVLPFSLVDRILGSPIVHERNALEVDRTWTAFGFELASTFYFALAIVLLFLGLRLHFSERAAGLATFFMLIAQGAPLFAFRRPVFSHSYELFAQTAMLALALLLASKKKALRPQATYIVTGVLCGFISLVRYNNIVYALVWPWVVAGLLGDLRDKKKRLQPLLSYAILASMFLVFKILPGYVLGGGEKYASTVQNILFIPSLGTFLTRLGHLLWGKDWGLIFTAPYFLVGTAYLLSQRGKAKLKNTYFLPFFVWLIFLIPTLNFGSNGGWYGHRYLLFSALPLLAIPFAEFLDSRWLAKKEKWNWALWIWIVFPLASMLAFEGDSCLELVNGIQPGGRYDYGNPTYQLVVWEHVLEPFQFISLLCRGGPAYVLYLLATLLGLQSHLPAVFLERFPQFSWRTFIQWVLFLTGPSMILYFSLWTRKARKSLFAEQRS
ncbi:hypothetical protein K2X30_13030 [bacterium]|nr:hypothetical protein [bacterium]